MLKLPEVLCVVCRSPLDLLRSRESRVCRNPGCLLQYERAPDSRKCRHCGLLMPVWKSGAEHCGSERCRLAASESKQKAKRAAIDDLYDTVRVERDRVLSARRGPTVVPDTVPVAVVPRNPARMRKTAKRRHAKFEQHLRQVLEAVRGTPPEQDDPLFDQPPPLPVDEVRTAIAVCSACRGTCCQLGQEHAFVRMRTVRDFLTAHPDYSDDQVVQAYLSYLPARALHPGCVYQGPRGCALPRSMRSAICNRFFCEGLRRAVLAVETGVTSMVYIAHSVPDGVAPGTLRALPVLS